MRSIVFSAARAFFPLHGKSNEEAWEELTAMFNPNAKSDRSFILQHYPLECVKRHRPDNISVGDLFKYTMRLGSEMYVRIVKSIPYESFAFDVDSKPWREEDMEIDQRDRMEFFLQSRPEATLVEIRRREKAHVGWNKSQNLAQYAANKLFEVIKARYSSRVRSNPAQQAAENLQLILTGNCLKGDEITHGNIIIKRDDSYKIDF